MAGVERGPSRPDSPVYHDNWYSILHSYSMGMFCGIVSYVYFANALILSARIRCLDLLFGQDRVMVFHGRLAGAAFAFACAHVVFKYLYSAPGTVQVALGIAALALFAAVGLATVLPAAWKSTRSRSPRPPVPTRSTSPSKISVTIRPSFRRWPWAPGCYATAPTGNSLRCAVPARICSWLAAIGITPFMSILRGWDAVGIAEPVTLIWSMRTRDEQIDEGFLADAAARHAAYVCGPDPFRRAVIGHLRDFGLPRRAIHDETFSF